MDNSVCFAISLNGVPISWEDYVRIPEKIVTVEKERLLWLFLQGKELRSKVVILSRACQGFV